MIRRFRSRRLSLAAAPGLVAVQLVLLFGSVFLHASGEAGSAAAHREDAFHQHDFQVREAAASRTASPGADCLGCLLQRNPASAPPAAIESTTFPSRPVALSTAPPFRDRPDARPGSSRAPPTS